jgi:hypothetical protein
MKFKAVRFSTSVKVFSSENSVGFLADYQNEISQRCDSIEVVGQLLIIQRGDDVKAVPLSKMESGDPDLSSLMEELTAPKRGPGRPTNASKLAEGTA